MARVHPKKKPRAKRRRTEVQVFALVPAALQLTHPDPAKQKAINAFLKRGTVAAACNGARIGRRTWYDWAKNDELFARLIGEADEHVTDLLETEAQSRAVKGSDTLLIFLLKSKRRAIYGDRQQITVMSPDVQLRVQQTLQLIASRPSWDSEALLSQLSEQVWK